MFSILNSFSETITRVLDELGVIYWIVVIDCGNNDFIKRKL